MHLTTGVSFQKNKHYCTDKATTRRGGHTSGATRSQPSVLTRVCLGLLGRPIRESRVTNDSDVSDSGSRSVDSSHARTGVPPTHEATDDKMTPRAYGEGQGDWLLIRAL